MCEKILIRILLVVVILIGGWWIWSGLSRETVQPTREWKTYTNNQYTFSLKYPSSWEIEDERYHFIIFTPSKEKSWQPDTPADIPKNPKIRIDFGKYIRERLGPENFPETISPTILENWFKNNVVTKDFTKRTISNFQTIEITEIYVSGCEKVIYWRPTDLDNLIRIQTGCESQYLDEFNQIVNSLQQISARRQAK